jgi:hypothetical protein
MENKDKPALFPPGYEQLEQQILAVNQQVLDIDEQIKNMPYDKGPTLEYHPPGDFRLPHPLTRDQRIQSLRNYKSDLQTGAKNLVKSEVGNADKATAKTITDKADKLIHPSPYEGLNQSDIEKARGQVKTDMDQSQDFMRTLRFNHHELEEPPNGGNAPKPEIDKGDFDKTL